MQKTILLICAVVALVALVALVGRGKKDDGNTGVVKPNSPSPKAVPEKLITNPILEKAIREQLKKPEGELTKADLEKVTGLKLLDKQLTDVPESLEKLTQLRYLRLDHNKLTSVKDLEKLTQLTSLMIHNNKLTSVKDLEMLTQLTNLNLANNQLSDVKGLEKLTQLRKLNLRGNQLTDATGLEKLTKLEELYLETNPDLTKAQIDELKKALPNCKIQRHYPKK